MSKELPRESRPLMWLADFRRDVAYGVRTLLIHDDEVRRNRFRLLKAEDSR